MGYLLLALLGLGVLTALIALVTSRKGEDDKIMIGEQDCATCDGTDSRCEMTCRLEAAVNPIEYFDDEELDAFRAALYSVNTSFHCCNAAPVDWAAGWQRNELRKNINQSLNKIFSNGKLQRKHRLALLERSAGVQGYRRKEP